MMHFLNSATQLQHLILLRECGCETFDIFFLWVYILCVYMCTANVCMLFVLKKLSSSEQFVSLKKNV